MSNYYVFSNSDDCPYGWTKITTYAGRSIYGNGAAYGTTSGSLTSSHTHTTSFTTAERYDSGANMVGNNLQSTTITPAFKTIQLVYCKTTNVDNLNLFKKNSIIISEDTSCPIGWYKLVCDIKNIVVSNEDLGVYLNNNSHSHIVSTTVTSLGTGTPREKYPINETNTRSSSITNPSMIMPYFTATLCVKK